VQSKKKRTTNEQKKGVRVGKIYTREPSNIKNQQIKQKVASILR